MSRGVRVRSTVVAVVVILAGIVACSDDDGAGPRADGAPSPTGSASVATATAGTSATSAPIVTTTATAPPSATPTARPTATPTPEPRYDDVIASTTLLPLGDLEQVVFESGGASATLAIEVPPRREYGIGLSGRYQLADRGMLFYYPEGARTGFWMRNTHIDLDIAFVDAGLRVIAILQMDADTDTIHRPDESYIAAIEAPRGWYEAASITEGASVDFRFDVDAVTSALNASAGGG